MWSYYQYRKIARSVKVEVEKHGDKKGHINFAETKRDDRYEERRNQQDLEKGQTSEQTEDQSDENENGADEDVTSVKKSEDNTDNKSEKTKVERRSEGDESDRLAKLDTAKSSTSHNDNKKSEGGKKASSSRQNEDGKKDNDTDERFQVRTFGEDDPFDPRNWPLLDRCKNIAILALLIFVQAWAGAGNSQANKPISMEFNVSQVSENLSTAMYLFGISAGSLVVGPISETVGRNPTYLVGTFVYMLFQLGCARVRNYGGQIVCRFFVGLFCSATLAINGGSVRDQFRPVKRSFVFPVIAWANVAGMFSNRR